MAHRAYRFVVKNNECNLCRIAATLHQTGKRIALFYTENAVKGNP
ncbi:MAG TPA: hypothetical protein VIM89_23700 [Mucilaginibacter sp.]